MPQVLGFIFSFPSTSLPAATGNFEGTGRAEGQNTSGFLSGSNDLTLRNVSNDHVTASGFVLGPWKLERQHMTFRGRRLTYSNALALALFTYEGQTADTGGGGVGGT